MGSGYSYLSKSSKNSNNIIKTNELQGAKYQVSSTANVEESKRQTPKNIKSNLINLNIAHDLLLE